MSFSFGLGSPGVVCGTLWDPSFLHDLLWDINPGVQVTLDTTLRATGTLPPAVTISGTLTPAQGLYVQIDGAGTLGVATFKWSLNNGATFQATGVLTAASVALGSTGITVAFPVGAYLTDNVYRATVASAIDQSGNGRNVQAYDNASVFQHANCPDFIAAKASYNNRPVFEWPVGNTLPMLNTLDFGGPIAQPITYVMVAAMTNQASAKSLLNGNNTVSVANQNKLIGLSGTTARIGSDANKDFNLVITAPSSLILVFSGAASAIYKNGVAQTVSAGTTAGTAGPQQWRLGRASSGSTTSSLEGQIARALAFHHVPSAAEIAEINGWTKRTYGVG